MKIAQAKPKILIPYVASLSIILTVGQPCLAIKVDEKSNSCHPLLLSTSSRRINVDAAILSRLKAQEVFAQDPKIKDPLRSQTDLKSPPELYQLNEEVQLLRRIKADNRNLETLSRKDLRVEETLEIDPHLLRRRNEEIVDFARRTFMNNDTGFEKVVAKIQEKRLPTDQLVIRFFSTMREDLVRIHGTDRYGIQINDQRRVNWDSSMRNRDELLKRVGKIYQDALYVSPLLNPTLSIYYTEFLLGNLSIAIYDKRLLNEHDFEYYTFVDGTDKARVSALVGIVRSPTGNERLLNISSTVIDPHMYGF